MFSYINTAKFRSTLSVKDDKALPNMIPKKRGYLYSQETPCWRLAARCFP